MQAPEQVLGFPGDTVELKCNLPPLEHKVQVTQATWTRRTAAGDDVNVAVFHPTQGSSFPEPGRLEFVAARRGEELRDATLALRGLRLEDEANYTCRFALFPDGSKSARIRLRVLGEQGSGAARALQGPRWGLGGGGGEAQGWGGGDSGRAKGGGGAMMGGGDGGPQRGKGLEAGRELRPGSPRLRSCRLAVEYPGGVRGRKGGDRERAGRGRRLPPAWLVLSSRILLPSSVKWAW